MPPLYTLVISPMFLIDNQKTQNILIFLINLLFFALTIIILYKFVELNFCRIVGLISVSLYGLIPEFIYATYSIGTTQLYHLLIILTFYLITKEKFDLYFYFKLGILLLSLSYLRFDSILFIIFIAFYFLYKYNDKKIFLSVLIVIIGLIPWQIRNYTNFQEYVPLSTNTGLNLFRGNNYEGIGNWHNSETIDFISNYDRGDNFELELSKIYTNQAIDYIINNPSEALINSISKIFHLWYINPIDTRSYDSYYIIPWLIILAFGIFALFRYRKNTLLYFLFFSYHTIIAFIFFSQIRYQSMMKLMLIPLVAMLFHDLFVIPWKKMKKEKNIKHLI